jgi:hypothetical protein
VRKSKRADHQSEAAPARFQPDQQDASNDGQDPITPLKKKGTKRLLGSIPRWRPAPPY